MIYVGTMEYDGDFYILYVGNNRSKAIKSLQEAQEEYSDEAFFTLETWQKEECINTLKYENHIIT